MYKKIIFIATCLFFAILTQAQNAGQQLAALQAQRIKDSLNLSTVQHDSIYQVNLSLRQQKQQVRQQYSQDANQLRVKTQEVENSRDGRYQLFLTPAQMALYLQKKRNLLQVP
jgi:preprotein translocase subunit SecD